jgi:hypothetical protein
MGGRGDGGGSSTLLETDKEGRGVKRTSDDLQRDVATLTKQSEDLQTFPRELATTAERLRHQADDGKPIGKTTRRKAR